MKTCRIVMKLVQYAHPSMAMFIDVVAIQSSNNCQPIKIIQSIKFVHKKKVPFRMPTGSRLESKV